MRSASVVFLMVFIVSVAAMGEPELKGTPSELTVYLSGVPANITIAECSEVKVQADRVVVRVCVATENSSLEAALKSNQDVRTNMFGALKEAGISADKIAGSRFSSTPRYWLLGKKASSYKVENIVKITILGEKEFQEVGKIVDKFKEARYEGIGFEHSNKDELKRQATEKACEAIMKKKSNYEEKFGVKLVPRSIRENEPIVISGEENFRYARKRVKQEAVGSLSDEAEEPSNFNELVFSAYVIAEFTIVPK